MALPYPERRFKPRRI